MLSIVAAMLVFALWHSWTANLGMKARFQQWCGERAYHGWYRLTYNAFSLVTLIPALLWLPQGQILYSVPAEIQPIFNVLQLIGSLGVIVALLQIDLLRFAGIKQAYAYLTNAPLPLPVELLQTGGLYAFVRHPLYFFSLLSLWFIAPMTDTMFAFSIAATLYFLIGSRIEERRMVAYYGAAYAAYQARVGWMLPIFRRRNAIKY
jgi:protein-S-isoprenylcysteine O-methyltransferase Ste14